MSPEIVIKEEQWNKKRVAVAASIATIIIATFLFAILKPEPGTEAFLKSSGVVGNNTQDDGYLIEPEKYDEEAEVDLRGDIVYNTDEYAHVFDHQGFYKGNYFRNQYKDEEGNVKMRIVPEIIPNDGVIESYLTVNINDPHVIATVFLDEDWRREFGNKTLILYGARFFNQVAFNWTEISPGLYATTITQENADAYRRDAPTTPSLNIAVADRNRFAIMHGNASDVTMVVYK